MAEPGSQTTSNPIVFFDIALAGECLRRGRASCSWCAARRAPLEFSSTFLLSLQFIVFSSSSMLYIYAISISCACLPSCQRCLKINGRSFCIPSFPYARHLHVQLLLVIHRRTIGPGENGAICWYHSSHGGELSAILHWRDKEQSRETARLQRLQIPPCSMLIEWHLFCE